MLNRRGFIALLTAPLVGSQAERAFGQVVARSYPTRQIRIIHQYTPGGGTDFVARMVASGLQSRWGQPVIVEARPGAGGVVGTQAVIQSPPDGYTLLLSVNTLTIMPALSKKLPFDVQKDLAPIANLATVPFVLIASRASGIDSIADLIAKARANPGGLNFASVGVGSPHHLAMELFASRLGITITHIPYKGAAGVMNDMVAGHIPLTFGAMPSTLSFARAGMVKVLATTGLQRSPLMPDVPTIAESGVPGYEADAWYGLLAPAGTPADIIQAVSTSSTEIIHTDDNQKILLAQGIVPAPVITPDQFAAQIAKEIKNWGTLTAQRNIKEE